MSLAQQIPVVDLTALNGADPQAAKAAQAALNEGLSTFGLIFIKGHGIDTEALEAFYDQFVNFTRLPRAKKDPLGGDAIWYQRGYTPPNTEQAVAATGQPDFKECYFAAPIPTDPKMAAEYPQIFAENVWPEGHDGFKAAYLSLGAQLHAIGLDLLRGAALALSLEGEAFTQSTDGAPHLSRALRYLPLASEQVGNVLWGEEHTDFNLITILPGGRFFNPAGEMAGRPDEGSGLYLRTRATDEFPAGQRLRGVPPEGCIVAQVGQQLEILSGGHFQATPHVITPPETVGWTRCSLAHFVHVHPHSMLSPLPEFRNSQSIESYRPAVLAGTYALKTLVDIGLAPPSELDRLGYRHYDRLDGQRKLD